MKKSIILVLLAVLSISFASAGSATPKFLKKAKDKITGKKEKKKAPVSKNVVLVKGLQITWCGYDVKDDGSVTIPALNGLSLPVTKGEFNLVLPAAPVFGDESELEQQKAGIELDFGTTKIYPFSVIFFKNKNQDEGVANGTGYPGFRIFYSDSDVKGTVDGEPVSLKKGWNIIGNKKNLKVSLMCAG